ncbi:hypothetical protein JR316_0008313 [Psilocybe cubensis]|uniref:F-box domain-containing protein n=2 Tax=Psilocybe cubensis TaxID=181762 RepID=A0A8H7XVY3_PSICU|nr:hypothetical protein JR316_0008313 [Psilocybe cubensis]KAH9479718.1 hypothetical protein JR316_0008313 [Psilocybe cubensis]
MNEYLDSADILTMARTCKSLRLRCYDIYLHRHKVISFSQSFRKLRLRIQILDNVPQLAIYILLSALPPSHFALENLTVSVDIDTLSLLDFSDLIRPFFETRIKVSSVFLYFNHSDLPIYNTYSQLPLAIITLLSSLGTDCLSLNIEGKESSGRPKVKRTQARMKRRSPLAVQASSMGIYTLDSAARRSMYNILMVDLDLAIFEPSRMRKLLPLLLSGSSVVDLTLSSPNSAIIQGVLQDLQLPSMETLKVTVHDILPITLPPYFSSQNPKIQRMSLLNVGHETNTIPYHKRPILRLPPLTKATFSANYSGWLMANNSSLASVEVHPPTTSNDMICDSIRSMIKVINCYNHTPASAFSHGLTLPVHLSSHTTSTSQLTCTCFDGAEDEVASNIRVLHLCVYTLNADVLVRTSLFGL